MVTTYSVESGGIKALNDFAFVYATDAEKPSITFQVNPDLPFKHREGIIATILQCNQIQGVNVRNGAAHGEYTFYGESSLCYLAINGVKFEGDLKYKHRARELELVSGKPGEDRWVRS